MPRYTFLKEFSHKIIILAIMNKRDVIKILNDILCCINSQKYLLETLRKVKMTERSNKSTFVSHDIHSIMNKAFEMSRIMKEESEDDIGSSEDEWEWRAIRGLDINSHDDLNYILLTLFQKKMN